MLGARRAFAPIQQGLIAPFYLEGFDHGLTHAVGGNPTYSSGTRGIGGILDAISGSIGTQAGRTGGSALRIQSGGTAQKSFITARAVIAGSVWVYVAALGGGVVSTLLFIDSGGNTSNAVITLDGPNALFKAGLGGTGSTAGSVTVTTGQWYRLGFVIDMSANPWTMKWRINGIEQTGISRAVAADTMTGFIMSASDSGFDDIVLTPNRYDYPVGSRIVRTLYPSANGTHNQSTKFHKASVSSDLFAIDANTWQQLGSGGFDNGSGAAQVTADTAAYLEWVMGDATGGDLLIGGVRGAVGHFNSVGVSTANLEARIRRQDGTETSLYAGTTAQRATNSTSNGRLVTPPSGGWTPAEVNALVARTGYASDIGDGTVNKWAIFDYMILQYDTPG